MPGDTTDGARRGGARCPVAVPTVNANAIETTATEATTTFMSDPSIVFPGLGRSDWISSFYICAPEYLAFRRTWQAAVLDDDQGTVRSSRGSPSVREQGINSGHVGRREKAGGRACPGAQAGKSGEAACTDVNGQPLGEMPRVPHAREGRRPVRASSELPGRRSSSGRMG